MAADKPSNGLTGLPRPVAPDSTERPAVRDATEIVERARLDELAAAEARARFRLNPIECIESGDLRGDPLEPGECLLAVRAQAAIERRDPPGSPDGGLHGTLLVTTRRLLLVGRRELAFGLDQICETDVVAERLVLGLTCGSYVWIDCDRPRLLRVELAAARARAMATGQVSRG